MIRTPRSRTVVVTGIGCVAPNGGTRESFWQACLEGRSGIRRVARFADANLEVQIAGECVDFDPSLAASERDQRRTSRTAILALAATREALAHAAISDADLAAATERAGVVLGTGGGAADFLETQYAHYFAGNIRRASVYSISSGTMGTLSSEINIALGLRGLSHVVTSGCASSTDAIDYAARLIRDGELDIVITGGADAPLTPGAMAGFCLMGVLATGWNDAPERASRPFQCDRNGFVLGEGSWMFVLESEESARARGAKILATILGGASTCDAFHRVQTDPGGIESARAMSLAIDRAGITPADIGHLSLHGTSTQMNDATEYTALRAVFGKALDGIPAHAPKSLVGHPQGASGALGIALAILALNHGLAPPSANQDNPDPALPLDLVRNQPRPITARYALCNCLAFGSKNSAIVLRTE